MESVDLLGLVISSIPPQRQLLQQRSNRDKQSFWKNDIRGIRARYRKGNGQTRKYRGLMNGWSFSMAQRQLEYKARWAGLPVIRLSRRETRGSSVACPRCGERLQSDKRLQRKLWCGKCRVVLDRDRVAAVYPGSAGTGVVRTFPAYDHSRGARRSS